MVFNETLNMSEPNPALAEQMTQGSLSRNNNGNSSNAGPSVNFIFYNKLFLHPIHVLRTFINMIKI